MTGGSNIEYADRLVDQLGTQRTVVADVDSEIVAAIRGAVALRAVVDGVLARLTSQAERVGVAKRCGMTLRELLVDNGVAPAVASRLIRLGRATEVLQALARHSRDGGMSAEHLDAVARGIDHVARRTGETLESDLITGLEHRLISHALSGASPAEIVDAARTAAITHTPAEPAAIPVAEDPALNEVGYHQGDDGRLHGAFDLDVATGERLITALDKASKPRPRPDGTPDERSAARRRADAFGQLLELATRGLSPDALSGPPSTEIVVTVPLDRSEPSHLTWLGPISDLTAKLLRCDAKLLGVGVDLNGAPVSVAADTRLFTGHARKVVLTRDQGCIKCGAPASWCDVHHITHYADGGTSIVDNGCLLCRSCHTAVHTAGWDIIMGHDRHPWLIPPAAIDPKRTSLPAYNRRTLTEVEPIAA
ncbi:HNH endonuclease signature motif containing protein [Williamsia sp. Leaf354]|jgi:ferredoxin|uniref:HNH endonuclease signature motif containing protein n=1 Tax=Williamsia sp. Leaf354 TaxID=1736349 RepID=UPI000AECF86E|nr:HNH endonuclease signature motif containing protein [Williamsia sp. Leaf354]